MFFLNKRGFSKHQKKTIREAKKIAPSLEIATQPYDISLAFRSLMVLSLNILGMTDFAKYIAQQPYIFC